MIGMMQGTPVKSFDVATATASTGVAFALLPQAQQVQWTTFFGTNPDAISLVIQTSLDNVVWDTVVTTTTVGGATGFFQTSAIFIRAKINSITNGVGVSVDLVSKVGIVGLVTPSSVTDGSLVLYSGTTGSKFGELAFPGDAGLVLLGDGTFGQVEAPDIDPSILLQVAGLGIGTAPFAGYILFPNSLQISDGMLYGISGITFQADASNLTFNTTTTGQGVFQFIDGFVIPALASPSGNYQLLIDSTGLLSSAAIAPLNPFDQDLNTTDSPSFDNLTLNGTTLTVGAGASPSTFTADVFGGLTIANGIGNISIVAASGITALDRLFAGVSVSTPLITNDSGDLTLQTTTSGNIKAIPSGAFQVIAGDQPGDSLNIFGGSGTFGITVDNGGSSFDYNLILAAAGLGGIQLLDGQSNSWLFQAGNLTAPGSITAIAYIVNSHPGVDASITTGSLVGKTITVEKGIITGFA